MADILYVLDNHYSLIKSFFDDQIPLLDGITTGRRSMFLSGMQAPRICFLNPIETLFFFEHLTFQEFSESG